VEEPLAQRLPSVRPALWLKCQEAGRWREEAGKPQSGRWETAPALFRSPVAFFFFFFSLVEARHPRLPPHLSGGFFPPWLGKR
jgi:hypothetical protein